MIPPITKMDKKEIIMLGCFKGKILNPFSKKIIIRLYIHDIIVFSEIIYPYQYIEYNVKNWNKLEWNFLESGENKNE